jgi:carbon-monoxide dehydrogenase large subunit
VTTTELPPTETLPGPAATLDAPAARPPIGQRLARHEDPRLLTGHGHFLDDHAVEGLCHVAIARSPFAHARLVSIDTAEARGLPGVIAVVTQADLEAAGARRFAHLLTLPGVKPLTWGVLAGDRVRFVGEPMVAVVATSRAVAEDAIELLEIDYDELPPVVGMMEALAADAPLLYDEWGTNEFLHMEGAAPGADAALAGAGHRLKERFESHRIIGLPLEGHGAQAIWDPGSGRLVVTASSQQPHQLRTVIAEVCGLAETDVQVISPDMGGGFGNKQHFTREECLVGLLARMVGRPVRWSQDRTESLIASVHSRPQIHDVDVGYDDDGRVLAMRVDVTSDLGNPVLYFSGIGPSLVTIGSLTGGYDIAMLAWTLSAVATTTCPVGAYRGFGQPEAHLTTERVMDLIAADLGLDPAEVRRRNLIPADPRPFFTSSGLRVDTGDLDAQWCQTLKEFGYRAWRDRQLTARAEGRFVGIGLSFLVQGTAPNQHSAAGRFASLEMASVSVLPDGRVRVLVGTKSQGQGHETVFAQVAASVLGTDADRVRVADGDTEALMYGQGTFGSRSAVMAGGAVVRAAEQVRDRMTKIAAHLGCDLADPGVFDRVSATAWWHPHMLPAGLELGLSVTTVYSPGFTDPQPDEYGKSNHDETCGSYTTALAVEVDGATGRLHILDALMVSDCGVVINPMVVEGQHQGAFAQGIGNALFEELPYSSDGQPLATTLLDYTIPTAVDVPVLRVVHRQTPSGTAGGFRGMGEAGISATPVALVGAVDDALRPLGIRLRSTRLRAGNLRAAMRAAGYRPDPAVWADGA